MMNSCSTSLNMHLPHFYLPSRLGAMATCVSGATMGAGQPSAAASSAGSRHGSCAISGESPASSGTHARM